MRGNLKKRKWGKFAVITLRKKYYRKYSGSKQQDKNVTLHPVPNTGSQGLEFFGTTGPKERKKERKKVFSAKTLNEGKEVYLNRKHRSRKMLQMFNTRIQY